jgi:GNAT superfamily N-acetyltransferase
MDVAFAWRGDFGNAEVNELHAEAFDTEVYDESAWNWRELCERHSLGWVVARDADGALLGFVNVVWDGSVHAWIQDTMVASGARHHGIGRGLVEVAAREARDTGCEWLDVDFEDHLRPFYFDACGFTPTNGGLIQL